MIVTRNLSFKNILSWSWMHIIWLFAFMGIVGALYELEILNFTIPWLPVSVIGTSVAFYVGFKNNQAYDRMWEARKIWGGIVNESRAWGTLVDAYISNLFRKDKLSNEEIHAVKKRLIYRHIAWLYAHRSQLLIPTPWEHVSQGGHLARQARYYQKRFGVGLLDDDVTQEGLKNYLPADEYERMIHYANTATQIINEQSRDLRNLREQDLIDDFRIVHLEDRLKEFYALQGKNERIKKFPLPRQYANMSRYFVGIFIFLLPFSMVPELMKMGVVGFGISIPIAVLIGWIYVMMELIGDYSENPFQSMANDIPMMSLCRTIEIDLRQMLNETDLPKPIEAKNGILM